MINPERWERIEDLLTRALELASSQRIPFLRRECAGDDELLGELLSLLAAHERPAPQGFRTVQCILSALEEEYHLGQRLGSYRLDALLGRGGVGLVYRAVDSESGRVVALKVFASGQEDRGHLERECRAMKAIRHPNVVEVLGFGEAEGTAYLVMECIDGETLAQRLRQGPLLSAQLAGIALQIADGLAAAHRAGIVHGDLKPGNVMLDREGCVKLLDFGLSRSLHPETNDSSTFTGQTIRGTVAYLSPEQVQGQRPDARSDVFSFGAMLQELATGERPFQGETPAATMGAILHLAPRPIEGVSRELRALIARCLEKNPAQRFNSASELQAQLTALPRRDEVRRFIRGGFGRWWLRPARIAAMAGLAAAAGWGLRWVGQRPAVGPTQMRLLSHSSVTAIEPAFSPDGRWVTYAAQAGPGEGLDIWVQDLPDGEPRRLTFDEADDRAPNVSPDGQWIAFRSVRGRGGIYRVRPSGGAEQWLAPLGRKPRYSPDGKWLAFETDPEGAGYESGSNVGALYMMPAGGGTPRRFRPEIPRTFAPVWSPDSRFLLFSSLGSRRGEESWWVAAMEDGPAMRVRPLPAHLRGGYRFEFERIVPQCWLPDGRLVFQHYQGSITSIMDAPFSLRSAQFTGPPKRTLLGADNQSNPVCGPDGQLLFVSNTTKAEIWSVPTVENPRRLSRELRVHTNLHSGTLNPHISPDGASLVYSHLNGRQTSVRRRDLDTGTEHEITTRKGIGMWMRQSSGGRFYAIYDELEPAAGVRITANHGASAATIPVSGEPIEISPDGQYLLSRSKSEPSRVLLQTAAGEVSRTPILHLPGAMLRFVRFSPDQRWLVIGVQRGDAAVVSYIAPFRGPVEIPFQDWQSASTVAASHADWAPDGRRLYFFSRHDGYLCLWTQKLDATTKLPIGASEPVQHFHHFHLNLQGVPKYHLGLTVSRDRVAFNARGWHSGVWWVH
ncbi:MAG: serine/threonine-protein kinase [Bryobacterales bacterium]|nr:serine/threonine-protein kinase [Bryobacterales bacterium]